MLYKYAKSENYEDYASGRVIYGKAGIPNFPVKLGLEIFGRCLEYADKANDLCVYDPCCGGGYLLTTLGFQNYDSIGTLAGSDINPEFVDFARKNVSLLTIPGLEKRKLQIELLYKEFGKVSHLEALESIKTFQEIVEKEGLPISSSLFVADILKERSLAQTNFKADIVITDVPYGDIVNWTNNSSNEIDIMLDNLISVVDDKSLLAIIHNKTQKINNEKFVRLEKFKVGKRIIEIIKLK